jgi:hypothetical protein
MPQDKNASYNLDTIVGVVLLNSFRINKSTMCRNFLFQSIIFVAPNQKSGVGS